MLITGVGIRNYRSLKDVPNIPMGPFTVLVGKNDAGKSSVLYALDMFFKERQPKNNDFSRGCASGDAIEVEVTFEGLDDETSRKLEAMRFLSGNSKLIVKKTFKCGSKQIDVKLKTYDFLNQDFQNLHSKKEQELNAIGAKYAIEFTRAGRSITNENKINQLVEYATRNGFPVGWVYVDPDKDSWKKVEEVLPQFEIFPSELNLEIERTEVQSPFQLLVEEAVQQDEEAWSNVRCKVEQRVSEEVSVMERYLLEQTDAITKLAPRFDFQWRKMTTMNFDTEDESGANVPLENRGMGVRRLVMVAFLRYKAERSREGPAKGMIFGIEEPETCLHPSAQRTLIESLRTLRDAGDQIVLTSHSPVFAAEASHEDIVLVKRQAGRSIAMARQELEPEQIVEELGIEPRDQLASFNGCIFVEGRGDEIFLSTVARTLNASGKVPDTFENKGIGLLQVGGNNLCFFVEGMLLKRINRRFAVVVDSDRRSATDTLSHKLLKWKNECETAGGKFHILRRREIENYLHPAAIKRVTGKDATVSEYNEVKGQIASKYDIESHLRPIISQMTEQEVLEMDRYLDQNGNERHELVELVRELLTLVE